MTVRATWAQAKNVVKVLYIDSGRTAPSIDGDVLLLANFDSGDARDLSIYEAVPVVTDTWEFENGRAKLVSGADVPNNIQYSSTGIDALTSPETKSYTLEALIEVPAGTPSGGGNPFFELISGVGPSVDIRIVQIKQTTDPLYGKIRCQNGGTIHYVTDDPFPSGIRTHFCWMYRGSDDGTPHVWLFAGGVPIGDFDASGLPFHLPDTVNSAVWVGGNPAFAPIYFDNVRLKLGLVYDTAGFTPPASLPDPVQAGSIGNARFVERAVQQQNLANIQARSGVIAGEVIPFRGFSNAELANLVRARVVR